jgi:hypothetical protein
MTRFDDYRSALLAANSEVSGATLVEVLEAKGPAFPSFIVDHGLGPLWHARTGRDEFRESRLAAEAYYLVQDRTFAEIDGLFEQAGIEHAVIKGAANRRLLYDNPAVRACHDIDLLVHADDRVIAATELVAAGFAAVPEVQVIGHELALSRGAVTVDLHWGLLREGRLAADCAAGMLRRRRRVEDMWMLSVEDALFVLLVHPAFAKHLASWEMGLHRVADILRWLQAQSFDWPTLKARLERNGVLTAAWASLRWLQMLTEPNQPAVLVTMLADTCPGRLRRAWLDCWLRLDLSQRMSSVRWLRLVAFSPLLHDTPGDAMRALHGRRRAHRRRHADLKAFQELFSQ